MLIKITTYVSSEWADVTLEVLIYYDLEAHPLQIKTDSEAIDRDLVWVKFYKTGSSTIIGEVILYLYDPPQLKIGYCVTTKLFFPVTPSVEQDKIWTLTKTDTGLKIECNGVEVLNYLFSESTLSNCVTRWSEDVVRIEFATYDSASDGYRPEPSRSPTLAKKRVL